MNITQVASVAAAFEGARTVGIQQAGAAAAASAQQREVSRVAEEADVRETEAVQPTEDRKAASGSVGRNVDITV